MGRGVSAATAAAVLADLAAGYSPAETAARQSVSRPTVYRLRRVSGGGSRRVYQLGREVMAKKRARLEELGRELAAGKTQRAIAAEWGLSRQRISQLTAEWRDGERRKELERDGR